MAKLDKKQLPQVIALGVLTVGLLGWAGAQWFGSKGNVAQADPRPTVVPGDVVPPANGPGNAPAVGDPGNLPPLLGPSGYNPDPFRSRSVKPVEPVPPKPPVVEPPPPQGPYLPPGGADGGGGFQGGPPVVAPPPAPVRPTLSVTGIIDVEGGMDMALVEMNAKQQIVQVGDMVDKYRVKRIGLDGVLLVNGKDRFFVALASPDQPKS